MAQAYFNSLSVPHWQATSSGIKASRNLMGPISWYTKTFLEKHNLLSFTESGWKQTTKELLEESDYVIFMQEAYFTYCVEQFKYIPYSYESWEVLDLDELLTKEEISNEETAFEGVQKIFSEIKKNIDKFVATL